MKKVQELLNICFLNNYVMASLSFQFIFYDTTRESDGNSEEPHDRLDSRADRRWLSVKVMLKFLYYSYPREVKSETHRINIVNLLTNQVHDVIVYSAYSLIRMSLRWAGVKYWWRTLTGSVKSRLPHLDFLFTWMVDSRNAMQYRMQPRKTSSYTAHAIVIEFEYVTEDM